MTGEEAQAGQGRPRGAAVSPAPVCLSGLLWSRQTFPKARAALVPFPEDSLRMQGPRARGVKMALKENGQQTPFHILLWGVGGLCPVLGLEPARRARGQKHGGSPALGCGE